MPRAGTIIGGLLPAAIICARSAWMRGRPTCDAAEVDRCERQLKIPCLLVALQDLPCQVGERRDCRTSARDACNETDRCRSATRAWWEPCQAEQPCDRAGSGGSHAGAENSEPRLGPRRLRDAFGGERWRAAQAERAKQTRARRETPARRAGGRTRTGSVHRRRMRVGKAALCRDRMDNDRRGATDRQATF